MATTAKIKERKTLSRFNDVTKLKETVNTVNGYRLRPKTGKELVSRQPDQVRNGKLIVNNLDNAAHIIVTLSYGDRAGASMLFDVCVNGKKTIHDAYLGGSIIWRFRHRLDKLRGSPKKVLRTKRSIASHLAEAGMVKFDGEVISPRIREIVFHLSAGTKVRTVGPSIKEIHDFLRSIIPKAVSSKKFLKAKKYLAKKHYDIRIILPRTNVLTALGPCEKNHWNPLELSSSLIRGPCSSFTKV